MEMIDYILFVIIGGWLFVTYMGATMDAALKRREKAIKRFNAVITDEKHSLELRQCAAIMFHLSINRWFLPKMLFRSMFGVSKKGRELLKSMSRDERKMYFDLIMKEMLPVNALLTPHWYLMFFMFFFVAWVIVSAFKYTLHIGIAPLKTRVEANVIGQATLHKC